MTVGNAQLDGTVEATTGRYVIRPRAIGVLSLDAGPATLEMKPLEIAGSELMALHKIWLRRLPE
jgi:hypothetical protein